MEFMPMDKSKLANFYLDLQDVEEKINSMEWKLDLPQGVKDKWERGLPVFSELQVRADEDLVHEMLQRVVESCRKWQIGPQTIPADTGSIIANMTKEEKISLAAAIISNDNTAKESWRKKLNLSEEMMEFLVLNTARPFLKGFAAQVLSQLKVENWNKGYCPVCGDSPSMSRLAGKYGVRMLHCGRCETEWRYARVGCPFCGTTDASQLSFITADDYKQYRLYLCEQCKSYLKTVDERHCAEVDLFCEDLATADFDRLALKEGYRRGDKRYRA
ncbi:formate dehydrogenase accessory protein FdhE [Desulfofalx alkaliphila]|uniref:formate dehydrogenase accessory protein FdhE n=1 Tax=Desulfofalx alkaliphila TaxID=105483 RepID=UPI0004E156D7|nr:formate dehydrogenase accessory protein FdhE [Desulfofalx alkaliphila]